MHWILWLAAAGAAAVAGLLIAEFIDRLFFRPPPSQGGA